MRFRGQDANRISAGRKTEHRLPRLEEAEPPLAPGRIVPVTVMVSNSDLGYQRRNSRRPRKEGQTSCHIVISSCEPALLHEAGEAGARAEGWRTFDALVDNWWDRYRTGCGRPEDPHYPIELPVWVLRFHLDTTDRPRLLARQSDANRGYTTDLDKAVDPTDPDNDPGEAVGDEWYDRFSVEGLQSHLARARQQQQRVEERALEDRLAEVRRLADERDINLDRHLRRIEASLSAAEAKLHRSAA